MKQIKVHITPEQWADKRFQIAAIRGFYDISELDSLITKCGFELIEETKPEQPQMEPAPNGQNTDVDDHSQTINPC